MDLVEEVTDDADQPLIALALQSGGGEQDDKYLLFAKIILKYTP